MTSPVVIGLVLALALLVGLGVALQRVIATTVATRLYQCAMESFDVGDDRNAIQQFDEYLACRPGDPKKESQARVLRALADVRQFTTPSGASWSHALEAERAMVEAVGGEDAYRDSSSALDELVLKTAEALADRARSSADGPTLAEAESAVALHRRIAGASAEALLARTRLPGKLAEARAAVRKGAVRTKALAAMDAALAAETSAAVYSTRDALVGQYPDLAADRAVIERLTRANDLIRRAVRFDPTRRPAETAPHPEAMGLR